MRYQALIEAHPHTDAPVPTTTQHVEHEAAAPVPSTVHASAEDMTPQRAMMAFMQSVASTRFPPSRNNRTQSPDMTAKQWLGNNRNGVRYGAVGQGMALFRSFQRNHPELLAEFDHQHDNKMIAALSPPDAHARPDLKLAHAHLTPDQQQVHNASLQMASATGQPGFAGLRNAPGMATTGA